MTKRPQPLTCERQAKLEIGHTEFSPGVKWTLFTVGLFTLFAVPAVQILCELRDHVERRRDDVWPQCFEVFDAMPRAVAAYGEHDGGWISKTFRGNTVLLQAINNYENDLKAESFLTQFVLPPTQEILVLGGSGNEKAYVGRRRWLFYRPGIDYCTGPGFLDPWQIAAGPRAARRGGRSPNPTRALRFSNSNGNSPSETYGS